MKIMKGINGTNLVGTPYEIAKWIVNNQRRFKLNKYNFIIEHGNGKNNAMF